MALIFGTRGRLVALAALFAGTTMLAGPASAAPPVDTAQPRAAVSPFDFSRFEPASEAADWRCRWRCGWGGGWGRHRGWRRDRIDGGDVLIGAAIIGGALAIASANNRRERERDVVVVERDPDLRDRDRNRDDRRGPPRGTGASGLDNAVNMCLDRIERDVRVDTVDNVERTASGWQVTGALFNGSAFRCRINNSGQIDMVDYGDGFAALGVQGSPVGDPPPAPGQWSDERYARARAALGGAARPDMALSGSSGAAPLPAPADVTTLARSAAPNAMTPAYPGGPIPGEVIPETYEEASGG